MSRLRVWCTWDATLTHLHSVSSLLISIRFLTSPPRLPLYYELKILFVLYLMAPQTMGATTVYDSFLLPLLNEHEDTIDGGIVDVRAVRLVACAASCRVYIHPFVLALASHFPHDVSLWLRVTKNKIHRSRILTRPPLHPLACRPSTVPSVCDGALGLVC